MSHPGPGVTSRPGPLPHSGLDSAVARYHPHGFVYKNSHENFPMGHLSWDCSRTNSLNFGVSMKLEASELPKGLMLGRDENIHIRLT
ncbi:hypothetical protein DVH24_013226 [Malus domestica]|uniref:Uncharacterized protein n=1 Tax=Malus domestica TaxID=3750 RepID=A0A498HID2_MALDO|nr:hypothetical protein DVH24_013226 [Malus domestica]